MLKYYCYAKLTQDLSVIILEARKLITPRPVDVNKHCCTKTMPADKFVRNMVLRDEDDEKKNL